MNVNLKFRCWWWSCHTTNPCMWLKDPLKICDSLAIAGKNCVWWHLCCCFYVKCPAAYTKLLHHYLMLNKMFERWEHREFTCLNWYTINLSDLAPSAKVIPFLDPSKENWFLALKWWGTLYLVLRDILNQPKEMELAVHVIDWSLALIIILISRTIHKASLVKLPKNLIQFKQSQCLEFQSQIEAKLVAPCDLRGCTYGWL